MSYFSDGALCLRDLTAHQGADKKFDRDIVDLMSKECPIIGMIPQVEANNGTTNMTKIRTGLPSVTWTAIYEGVQASKGSKQTIKNTAGTIDTKLEIAKKLYDLAPDKDAVILDEVSAHVEAMNQEMEEALIYGNIKDDPRKFNGIMRTYTAYDDNGTILDSDQANHYCLDGNVLSANSITNRASILLVGWGNKTFRGFYPQNGKMGLEKGIFKKDVEINDGEKGNGYTYEGHVQHLTWTMGLDVRDFRYGGRIANIDRCVQSKLGQFLQKKLGQCICLKKNLKNEKMAAFSCCFLG